MNIFSKKVGKVVLGGLVECYFKEEVLERKFLRLKGKREFLRG